MIKQIRQVEDFHRAFGAHIQQNYLIRMPDHIRLLRKKLIEEETKEVSEELDNQHYLPNLAKELADLCYVIFGTVVSAGLQTYFEACFDEVHNSNMSKLGEDGKPIYREDGKVLKGPNYFQADLSKIL